MAPTDLLHKVKSYWKPEPVPDVPALSVYTAVAILLFYTALYVLPFYISSSTRPSPTLSRDAPSVIRARITSVSWTCAMCAISTFIILSSVDNGAPLRSFHSMGFFPLGLVEAGKSVLLTSILFLGPIFEAAFVEGAWRDWIRLRGFRELFGSWIGYRKIVAGPVTEEILFRSCSIPLFILAQSSLRTIFLGTPLIFGLAHIHHFYEFRITHPHTPISTSIFRSLFQLGYTTLFGCYATFLYLRTGSVVGVILVHAFCNWMGLPRFWGRVEGGGAESIIGPDAGGSKRNEDGFLGAAPGELKKRGILWSFAYYILLVAGATLWWKYLWVLSASELQLLEL